MSISQTLKNNKIKNNINKCLDAFERVIFSDNNLKVFFPYKSELIHPVFDEIKRNPPLSYSNRSAAQLRHLIAGPSKHDLGQNQIIEIIDHALSVSSVSEKFEDEPIEYIKRIDKCRDIYGSTWVKKIIMHTSGQKEIFNKYFTESEIREKIIVLPLPWKNNIEIGEKLKSSSIEFSYIASNFITKGALIVINAWNKFNEIYKGDAKLTIVCHDIPNQYIQNKINNLEIIKKIPLSINDKNSIFKKTDVSIVLTLTDGISAIEATSYGKPIIVNNTQHGNDFVNNGNGIMLQTPLNIYDYEKYGTLWKQNCEFELEIMHYHRHKLFENVENELANKMWRYANDRDFLENQRIKAIENIRMTTP